MCAKIFDNFKRCAVQRIINPITFWVIECENEKSEDHEISNFALANNIEKYTGLEKLQIGDIIAVVFEEELQRGLITDIFHRNSQTTYGILLIDNGRVTESSEKNLYLIKNKRLKDRTFNTIEVLIPGLKPVAIEIKYDKGSSSEVFLKGFANNWSPMAFVFVRNLLENTPFVFVKPVHRDKKTFLGEIFVLLHNTGEIKSLGELLCQNGFAMPQDFLSESTMTDGQIKLQGDISIEDKIPKNALDKGIQVHAAPEMPLITKPRHKNKQKSQNSDLPVASTSLQIFSSSDTESKSSDISSVKEIKKSSVDDIKFSSSWILKKLFRDNALFPDYNPFSNDKKIRRPLKIRQKSPFTNLQKSLGMYDNPEQDDGLWEKWD